MIFRMMYPSCNVYYNAFTFADVLRVLFEILSQEIDVVTMDRYPGMENIFRMSLKLLQYLTRGFDLVQRRVFDRLDGLLRVSLAKAELAMTLKEVSLFPSFPTNVGLTVHKFT
jgi:hypothetical protein